MRVKKIIKEILFVETIRPDLIMSENVRMNPTTQCLQLKLLGGSYSILTNEYAITPIFSPNSVKRWVGFDVYAGHSYEADGTPITSLKYRLSDGVDQYTFDGNSWVVDATGWNTEEEISANISTLPMTTKKISIVINLLTSDQKYTPIINRIKLLFDSNIEFQEDLVARTIIPAFKENIRPISELLIESNATTNQIFLNDFPMDTKYDLVSIDSVFNHTSDPEHFSNILSSYDTGTKIIQLTEEISQGDDLWVNFIYRPLVAISTDTEFSEDARVPAIHITDVNVIKTIESFQGDYVRSKGDGTAIKIPSVQQKDVSFSLMILTSSAKDLQRLADEIRTFFKNNRMITSNGLDEEYPTKILSDFSIKSGLDSDTLHTGFFRFAVLRASFYQEKEENAYMMKRIVVGGDMNTIIGENSP